MERRDQVARRPLWRSHLARCRKRPSDFGDVCRRADPLEQRDRRRRQPGQAGAELRPVHRGRTRADAVGRCRLGCRAVAVHAHPLGLAGAPVRPHRRLHRMAAHAARFSSGAHGAARRRHGARCVRGNARCRDRPQLCRRLRTDLHARDQEPALRHSRRRRVDAGRQHAGGRARALPRQHRAGGRTHPADRRSHDGADRARNAARAGPHRAGRPRRAAA